MNFQWRFLIDELCGWDNYFVFNPQPALKFKDQNYVEVYGVLVSLNLEMSCLNSAASLVQ